MNRDDELLFADETDSRGECQQTLWKVLIADDEEEVHAVTRMVLDKFSFEGRKLKLFSAYSGQETKRLLQQHPDIAVLLLDVVMEEDTTGLEVVRYIREELQNHFVRIVLRTGQPGQAPERQVTMEYDINDYKEKTELTAQKLFTTITGLLRAYRDLRTIEKSRKGLEYITEISASLFKQQLLHNFMSGLLTHIASLFQTGENGSSSSLSGVALTRKAQDLLVIAGTEDFRASHGLSAQNVVSPAIFQFLIRTVEQQRHSFLSNMFAGYFATTNGSEHLLYIEGRHDFNQLEQELLKVLMANVAVALENLDLNQAIIETQREVLFTLGEVVETRTRHSHHHVKNVAEWSYRLALKAGLSQDDANLLRLASPLHDVGKLGIPDEIIHKQDTLTDQEYHTFIQHPLIGYQILKNSRQPVIRTAAQMALQHHERWDGKGYPQGLKETEIHIFARITKIADAFDELCHPSLEEEIDTEHIVNFFTQGRGTIFDPNLVDIFLEHLDEFLPRQTDHEHTGQ